MAELGFRGKLWLKGTHILFAGLWIGGGITLLAMQLGLDATGGGELFGINRAMKFVDDFIIIPGAFGSLLTGLIYAIFTNWGFFKHNWITIKWIINTGGILFGTFFLGPWVNSLVPMAERMGIEALAEPQYIHNSSMNLWFGLLQVSTLIFALFISILKPWSKK